MSIYQIYSVKHLLETSTTEEIKEEQHNSINDSLSLLKNLDQEMKMLQEEKISLQEIEENLAARLDGEIERRKQEVEQLKAEVMEIRKRCEELTSFVNTQFAPE
jgi:predicted nuclease with TOPRIM domain